MDCFSKVTLRQVIEKMYKSGRRRDALLAYPLIDLPLADAFLQRDSIMKDLIQLPSIGRGTVVDIDRAIREHAGLSEVSPAKGGGELQTMPRCRHPSLLLPLMNVAMTKASRA